MEEENNKIIIYNTKDGRVKIEVKIENETVWLSQKQMATLFDCTVENIIFHLQNVFKSGELSEKPTTKDYLAVQKEGNREINRTVKIYNLDAIISIGYRINSISGTQFRIWATQRLREYIIKGFVLDDERLKNPDLPFDYFEELAKRIQDIRTSEKRFYRKITDIYALSVDYDPADEKSINFFKTVQNKMHWAITGKTAAELIVERADGEKSNMGLTNWRGNVPRKNDVIIAKNYLNEKELLALNNLVEQYLIFAEGQAMRRISMRMKDWIEKLHGFLQLNDRNILKDAGKISHELAKELAEKEYDKFRVKRLKKEANIDGDFEKAVKLIEKRKKRKEKDK